MIRQEEHSLQLDDHEHFFDAYVPDRQNYPFSVVFLPGATRDKEEYAPLGRYFAQQGALACVPDIPGIGRTTREFSVEGTIQYVTELGRFFKAPPYNAERVVLGGYSFGGRMALEVNAVTGNTADGLYAASAPRRPADYIDRALLAVLEKMGQVKRKDGTMWLRRLHTATPDETLRRFIEMGDAMEFAPRIDVPTLFLWGADFHVSQLDAYSLFREMSRLGRDVSRRYVGRMHGSLKPAEMERVGSAVLEHFGERFGRS